MIAKLTINFDLILMRDIYMVQTAVDKAGKVFQELYKKLKIKTPMMHVVLGSCFGESLEDFSSKEWKRKCVVPFHELEAFPQTTVEGHKGELHFFENVQSGEILLYQLGRFHGYEGYEPKEVVIPLLASFLAGTKKFILTNAAGGLCSDYQVGDVMIIKDHVNLTGQNPLKGPIEQFNGQDLGIRFPDMMHAYRATFLESFASCLKKAKLNVQRGTYLGLLGPSFETPAEIKLFHSWGLEAVGFSTVWESIFLKNLGADVAGLSLITNMGCGLVEDVPLDHLKILEEAKAQAKLVTEAIFDLNSSH